MGSILNVAGVVFEVLGLAIAIAGAWQTWRDMADPGEQPWSPVVRLSVRLRDRLAVLAARLFRRRRSVVVGVGGATAGVGSTKARARIGYGPLPKATRAAIDRLEERTRELRDALSDEQDAREDADEQLQTIIEEAAKHAADELDTFRREVQTSTIDGLRLQFIGFPIVLFGLVLQGIASLL